MLLKRHLWFQDIAGRIKIQKPSTGYAVVQREVKAFDTSVVNSARVVDTTRSVEVQVRLKGGRRAAAEIRCDSLDADISQKMPPITNQQCCCCRMVLAIQP